MKHQHWYNYKCCYNVGKGFVKFVKCMVHEHDNIYPPKKKKK